MQVVGTCCAYDYMASMAQHEPAYNCCRCVLSDTPVEVAEVSEAEVDMQCRERAFWI